MASSITACKSLSVVDGRLADHSHRHVYALKSAPSAVSFSSSPSVFYASRVSKTSLQWASSKSSLLWASPIRQGGLKKVAVMVNASEDVEEIVEEVEEETSSGFNESFGGNQFSDPPEEAKLYVGNLPFDVNAQMLGELFEEAGQVLDVNLITDRETGNSRGFGFVTMSTAEEVEIGIEKFNQYSFEGRLLTVRKASPRGTRVERPELGSSNKVYVGNLPWQTDDNSLLQLFSEHGKVLEARVVYDRDTGRSRGFGFVTYASQNEVNDAISALDGADMDGRPLRVSVAENRPRRF
ncbi:hypothetical protein SUGI_0096880 [Cryptomeria japonica]|uniref:28 kDa ribonucleoprotein, chloroplastic n=1 Tax=Cryptomeria japonica TaxID=3369 RepID=UPI0024089D1D|nr:28 kDa ribonucleoprotein, chloroplastic [Cryptomeria japonica]GLJ08837.1 hypothetical protein SUGI_0096880 [Cryptomeria japonica]